MKTGLVALVTSLFLAAQGMACDIHGKTGFAPDNNLRISQFDKATNGMTKERFESITKRVEDVYKSVIETKGGKLVMVNKWEDDTVNAYANRMGSNWYVNMFGGLARHPLVTDDGFMLVVCHELGHHIGGAPRKGTFGGTWASNEGQADYFGTMKCLRRVLENDDNESIVANMVIDEDVKVKCSTVYKNQNEIALCQRTSMAGKSLALLLGELGGKPNVAFNTPDKNVVKSTNDNHPAAQCRLDTYFQGTLCDKSWDQDVDNKNPITGTCTQRDGYALGLRPLCWYKPTAQEMSATNPVDETAQNQ